MILFYGSSLFSVGESEEPEKISASFSERSPQRNLHDLMVTHEDENGPRIWPFLYHTEAQRDFDTIKSYFIFFSVWYENGIHL
jgi:hypothetical protein